MNELLQPTSFVEVNAILTDFHAKITNVLGSNVLGMYVIGSLALGDFDPAHSDIDLIVVTDMVIADDLFRGLQQIHAHFAASGSLWTGRLEAVYVTRDALRGNAPHAGLYPQVERGTALFKAVLEDGWIFQAYTLREYALVVSGPHPRLLIDPVDSQVMRPAVAKIAGLWLEQAHGDPEWLVWVRQRDAQVFVIQTLCRMLYSLATGDVASKPAAARWAQAELGQPWAALIVASLARQHEQEEISQTELNDTLAFIHYTVERSQSEPSPNNPEKSG